VIHAIFIAREHGEPQVQVDSVQVISHKGIVGDRNFDKSVWPGQNLTLVELKKIKAFCLYHDLDLDLAITRRNVVMQNVDLNSLVGQRFTLGDVQVRGIELCEPCAGLGARIATESVTAPEAVKSLVGNAGLRVAVESDGVLSVGMKLTRFD